MIKSFKKVAIEFWAPTHFCFSPHLGMQDVQRTQIPDQKNIHLSQMKTMVNKSPTVYYICSSRIKMRNKLLINT